MSPTNFVTRRTALLTGSRVAAATALSAVPGWAVAQSDRPVRLVLPNATGSGVDARMGESTRVWLPNHVRAAFQWAAAKVGSRVRARS